MTSFSLSQQTPMKSDECSTAFFSSEFTIFDSCRWDYPEASKPLRTESVMSYWKQIPYNHIYVYSKWVSTTTTTTTTTTTASTS